MIQRQLFPVILNSFKPGFVTVIYGPRRVGKTILLNQVVSSLEKDLQKVLNLNGDTQEARDALGNTSIVHLENLVKPYSVISIDEAQRIPNIALSIKIIIDNFPDKKVIVTGSSSLDLATGMKETLTGRINEFHLFPFSTTELSENLEEYQTPYLLENQLLFGGYPYLTQLGSPSEKIAYLQKLANEYLFREITTLQQIAYPEVIKNLATLLAFQLGSEVSLNELATKLKVDVKTISKYIYLLKSGFIIFELGAFSRNLRTEVVKSKKYYFWDIGVRNSLIGQFASLDIRPDIGQIWENFLAVERLKVQEYNQETVQNFFWRSYEKAEVDWVEIKENKIRAFEFKWKSKKITTPKTFRDLYKVEVKLISRENYLDFVKK